MHGKYFSFFSPSQTKSSYKLLGLVLKAFLVCVELIFPALSLTTYAMQILYIPVLFH